MDRTLLVLLAEAWNTGDPGDVGAGGGAGQDRRGGWRMSWKDWAFALIFILLATISATLYSEYRRSKSGAVLWGVIGTLLVAILLMLVRHLPF